MKLRRSVPSDRSLITVAASGFTLIELAIVIVIIGIIISILATVLPALIKTSKVKKAKAILEKVDYTLEGYIAAFGRCPCPDTDGDGLENRNDAGTPGDPSDDTCSAYVGTLPYLTLGVTSGLDVWQNPLKYAVYDAFVRTSKSGMCASLNTFITAAFDNTKLHITDPGGGSANQAYVIASGGVKDLDADSSDGFFDGFNEGNDVQFDVPDRIEFHGTPVSSRYDDLSRSGAFAYLNGRLCTGGGGGALPPGENTYASGCTNGTDDDGDTLIDCLDPDCSADPACSGGTNVVITTTSIPPGPVNGSYSTTFQATGGTAPYEWTLTNDGGFADFNLNMFSGLLTGTLDQCPGSYTIGVQVQDATLPADGGPKTDADSFTLQVAGDLNITRTSGDGTPNITWDSPLQQESFEASGGHLGNITWSLFTGGATGFDVESTGSVTAVIKKIGTTTANTYTFVLTGTDAGCSANTDDLQLTVLVTAAGSGPPLGNLAGHWTFDDGAGLIAADDSGNNNDGVLNNFPGDNSQWVNGVIGGALHFDGNDDIVDCGSDTRFNFDRTDTFSITAWVKTSDTDGYIITKTLGGNFAPGYEFGIVANKLQVYLIRRRLGDRFIQVQETAAGTLSDNTWHHVAVTYDGSSTAAGISLYIDGQAVPQTTVQDGLNSSMQSTASVKVGNTGAFGSLSYQGDLDDLRIYALILTPSDIASLFALGGP